MACRGIDPARSRLFRYADRRWARIAPGSEGTWSLPADDRDLIIIEEEEDDMDFIDDDEFGLSIGEEDD